MTHIVSSGTERLNGTSCTRSWTEGNLKLPDSSFYVRGFGFQHIGETKRHASENL